ncbi:class I SAM-dependent methyltransferase [Campylobacter lari]|uniref:class I SAM-dependent methyltransferase n=2 Tax=Campylobacter lari TaxID=201 RepID=UPI0021E6CB02|nr:class I SAM-dependent methyltransferase [Campylobacter lari]EIY6494723.1 class I SAM-dependent methyltransferase [Campylobacter lari]EKG8727848.1 class I SAM-dependent methyltransferase [Campylobacter lari]EKJ1227105.1 class I SAM-dependent methyltransferase [Campylobacter lari]EKK0830759.1 class I SAM-dependent methyltransferase [Campylobacter lari]MCV3368352.1 class I SAM-dependent methyltransferase [Campylobacter lari]
MDNSLKAYTQKYDQENYGLQYPDGHVIRFYERILKYKLNKTSGNILDFGCGNGIHSKYFHTKGFKTFGVDIVESLNNTWKNDPNIDENNFHVIKPNASIKDLFSEKMDLIFANQSLYYLPLEDFKKTIQEFYDICNDGAIIFATMMSDKGYSAFERSEPLENALVEVKSICETSDRLKESPSSFMRFTKDIEQLKEDFKPFKPLFWGDYELMNLHNFEGSVEHYIYIGQK